MIPSPFLNELPLEEMRKVDSPVERDWFEDDPDDESYPETWDLTEDDSVNESAVDYAHDQRPIAAGEDDLCQLPAGDRIRSATAATSKRKRVATAEIKTAADMLSRGRIPLTAYRAGIQVRHAKHGQGTIVAVTGRGPKRTARVLFADGEHSFRLAFADLELLDA